jgi:hypothetical protein
MEAILQIDNNLTIEEERIYNKIKQLNVDLQMIYKEHKNTSVGALLFKQAKDIVNLVD